MGDIAFPIYGYKDKWSDTLPFMQFVPKSRISATIGYLFLDFIETGGVSDPNDNGKGVGWQYAIQDALRVHNMVIEGFWRWLKEKMGLNFQPQRRISFAQLDAFRIYWNHHRVRSQKDKNMP
ncbi:hypothetical protein K438DRAFT_1749182 [Mycena galopus ATCC 62051]|nr:hypothetical protein K438DRAFT_1749182 [Mycena galopus ATCC 62051]